MSEDSSEGSFEGASLPLTWRATGGGGLELSTRHFKDGRQSLQWSWRKGSALMREGLALSTKTHPGAGMQGWIYREAPGGGRLTFRLGTQAALADGNPEFVFRFGLNFTGWRMFRVQFVRDAKVSLEAGGTIESLEIWPPEGDPGGTLWLDALSIAVRVSPQRSADFQVPEHAGDLGGWCEHWPLYFSQQTPTLPLPASVTEGQRRDFETISRRYFKWLMGEEPDLTRPLLRNGAKQVQDYIRRGWSELEALKVVRDAQGRIAGPGLVKDFGSATSFKHLFYDILMPLVFDCKINGNDDARRMVLDLFDYIHDQGWAEGSGLGDLWLNPLGFAPYCHAVVLMRKELLATGRLEKAVRAAMWYQAFGKTFSRFDGEYVETNADALRSILFTSLAMIVAMDDSPRKVQYMRGWLAWYNDALRISPRFTGLIKPDGLGFHHEGVYAGAYATEAYEFCALIAWLLHGTEFAAAPESIANLKRALVTQDTISNAYDVPYAVMGRMPRPGVRLLSAYAYLALAEGARPDATPASEMAGIFMRLWRPDLDCLKGMLSVDLDAQGGKFLFYQPFGRLQLLDELAGLGLPASPKPAGFFSKPWGALAVHRREDWMVAVKGWSQYVWDFEMHPKSWAAVEENVYARYWSYGTLQPITHGNPTNPVASGWNLDRGWDWCRWPGATTPHLSLPELYDPKTSWACRFFSAATFAGAVACEGRNGMFALKLHEHYYDPSFRAYKTYFFFDGEIVCLGSNIATCDAAHATGTTLFQSWMPEEGMPIRVNGRPVADFPFAFDGEAEKPLTLMDPYGNGYVIPDGRNVRVRRWEQQSRDAWNRGETRGAFSTAWFDHGSPPKDDGYGSERYAYAMLVQTDPARLEAYAKSAPFRVLMQNHQAHILEHTGQKTLSYALFETDWMIPHGIIRKTDTPLMAMVKETGNGIILSLADPDLRLPKRRNMGYLDSEAMETKARPSLVCLELRGRWKAGKLPENVTIREAKRDITVVECLCANGLTSEIALTGGA